jgi:Beta-propeller repeat/Abnormal spindle-like microcephaly-assoc'd, ASPM-SPD-2-Hydin
MMSARVCFLLFVSGLTMAQSNPAPPINQPLTSGAPNRVSQPDTATQGKMVESYGKLPLSFEANQGQTDGRVKFLSRGSGYSLFLTSDEAVFSLRSSKAKTASDKSAHALPARQPEELAATRAVLRMKLVKANPAAKIDGEDELPGKSNYFIGNDPKKWRSDVQTFAKVKYEGVYPGIDLVYYGNQRELEYDFVVAPGADPHRIQLDLRGAKSIARDEQGDLVLQTGVGEVRWHKPVAYQEKNGTRQLVAARYAVTNTHEVRFEVARYDARRALYIDPLIYSTYLGGSGYDVGLGIAVDSSGNAYVTGYTTSANFPTKNPLQPANGGGSEEDAFVLKLNASGSALIYSTYLGGSSIDQGFGIAVDSEGDAYVTGYAGSTNFPVTRGAFQTVGGVFVTKLNPAGSALVYSTLFGSGEGQGIAVDSSGNAYVTGYTGSANFPTMNPLQPAYGGNDDAFVTEINPAGTALVYSTYLGGSGIDSGQGIAVDSSGSAYVTGYTSSFDFPTVNPLQAANAGGPYAHVDAFIAKVDPSGSALVYSTYLGGTGRDTGFGIAVDSSGDAYVAGETSSKNFPTTPGALRIDSNGNQDSFVTKINPAGSALVYSTYLGGSSLNEALGIALDSSGNAYVTGYTASVNFPTANPFQPAYGGGSFDAFMAEINPSGSALIHSSYLGGISEDGGQSIAVDSSGNAYVTGLTESNNFPVTSGAFQKACNGDSSCNASVGDAFVSKIALPSPAVGLVPANLNFGNQTVSFKSTQRASTLTNTGDGVLTISLIEVTGTNSGDFAETNNCPTSLASRKSCSITVTFTPATTGTRTASVSIADDAAKSPQLLPLTGVGILPTLTLSPTSLTFPTQVVYATSAAQVVTVKNPGLGIATIEGITVTGPFGLTKSCGPNVNPGGGCTFSVTFKPKSMGALTGSLTVTDNATNSPQKVTLTGTGTYVRLIPTSINFGNQPEGTQSLPAQITLTNEGTVAVTFTSIAITGAHAADFAQTNTCGTSVASGASCFINVTFTPSGTGNPTAQVVITDNGGGSPQTVSLVGTGIP